MKISIKCARCTRKSRNRLVTNQLGIRLPYGWGVIVRGKASIRSGVVIEYLCPDCRKVKCLIGM